VTVFDIGNKLFLSWSICYCCVGKSLKGREAGFFRGFGSGAATGAGTRTAAARAWFPVGTGGRAAAKLPALAENVLKLSLLTGV